MMETDIVIIGGGVAGLTAAAQISNLGYRVILLEKKNEIGGNTANWDRLFPDQRPAKEVMDYLKSCLNDRIHIVTDVTVEKSVKTSEGYLLSTSRNYEIKALAIIIATGYDLFSATRKEEYGYGIYNNVITSAELEQLLKTKHIITPLHGKEPARIGFVHCVGSRDEKVNNDYCSSVCCITAIKQAIEVKQLLPKTQIFSFYMDLRLYGRHFESLYREAQEKYGINYIRGRLSEASETIDGGLYLRLEDTLAGRPMKMTVDLLVLMVGMEPSKGTSKMASVFNIETGKDRFLLPKDEHFLSTSTAQPGIFVAGTATGAKSIKETIADAKMAAVNVVNYLKN